MFLIIGADLKELYLSHKGSDFETCGYVTTPCFTIGYTLEHCAKSNDIIKIDNEYSDKDRPFYISKTFPFKENLTMLGVNGRPVIASENLRALFDDQESTNLTTVALNIINIWFKGAALCKFTRAPNFTFIKILKCKVSPLAT